MSQGISWKLALISLFFLVTVSSVAFVTRIWVITAIPIGFLFGFFLERSDLCGSSAFSEVILMKDTRKVEGLWVVIATSMVLFALGSALGWFPLNPKPLIWANYLVGGVLFGIGMVLAGGCVSGTLFKVGQGNLSSMAALVGVPIGIASVLYGPLKGFNRFLKSHEILSADYESVTLTSLSGIPYGALALAFAGATLFASMLIIRHRRKSSDLPSSANESTRSFLQRILTHPWKPWQSGIAIGLLALAAYPSAVSSGRNYPLCVVYGVSQIQTLATESPVQHIYKKQPVAMYASEEPPPAKSVSWWMIALVTFLVVGAHVSARMRGSYRLLPKPPDETAIAFFGGLLVGAGATLATGCVVGNIMSGVALMSVGNLLFVPVVVLTNWATTYLYMMDSIY
jgi:uncharacterized membrane protein YedE/YeeE